MFILERNDPSYGDESMHIPPPKNSPANRRDVLKKTPIVSRVHPPGMMIVDISEARNPSALSTPKRRRVEICADVIRKTSDFRVIGDRKALNAPDAMWRMFYAPCTEIH